MRTAIDTAVIMAGGQGMRLRPYTTVLPKPLMPLGDRPLIEILIRQLGAAGVRKVIISVNHLAHIIRAVLGSTSVDGVDIAYQQEDQPLGTCGALTLMYDQLPERFLVVNGDLLSDYPVAELISRHTASDAMISIATRMCTRSVDFGVIRKNAEGRVTDYIEKPSQDFELSIGVYAIERICIRDFLAPGERADTPDLIHALLGSGEPVQAVAAECTWIDIGHPEDYLRAQELMREGTGFPRVTAS